MLVPVRTLSLAILLTIANGLPFLDFFTHSKTTAFPTLSITTINPTATTYTTLVGTGTGTVAPAPTGTGTHKPHVKKTEAQLGGYFP
ncbi:hypothetical protein AOQ84DRAFT_222106 [Glonium stellatum]|uniref:Uncharacterized protein n=1 Tax=Glonium stellatum TaxID=574774 RepID=A0A8E2JT49_9PEZI|nr:hypothetical protein AOQ84DRAFT_222106 [Glonium stellatum]